jgi:hypothetical protein
MGGKSRVEHKKDVSRQDIARVAEVFSADKIRRDVLEN